MSHDLCKARFYRDTAISVLELCHKAHLRDGFTGQFEKIQNLLIDVEKCCTRLKNHHYEVLRLVVIFGHTQAEAAHLLGVSLRTIVRRYSEALDNFVEQLLTAGILSFLGDNPLKWSTEALAA